MFRQCPPSFLYCVLLLGDVFKARANDLLNMRRVGVIHAEWLGLADGNLLVAVGAFDFEAAYGHELANEFVGQEGSPSINYTDVKIGRRREEQIVSRCVQPCPAGKIWQLAIRNQPNLSVPGRGKAEVAWN